MTKKLIIIITAALISSLAQAKPANLRVDCNGALYSTLILNIIQAPQKRFFIETGVFSSVFTTGIDFTKDDYAIKPVVVGNRVVAYSLESPTLDASITLYEDSAYFETTDESRNVNLHCRVNQLPF